MTKNQIQKRNNFFSPENVITTNAILRVWVFSEQGRITGPGGVRPVDNTFSM